MKLSTISSKKKLAILLSKLETFSNPKLHLEQYPTDPNIASELLWKAYLEGNISDKIIADLGAGTGILGIGALLLGSRKVFFVEKDNEAIEILRKNLQDFKVPGESFEIELMDISEFTEMVDTVVFNPPFGIQKKYSDRPFLEKSVEIGNAIYLIHNAGAEEYLVNFYENNGFKVEIFYRGKMLIRNQYFFHEREKQWINVILLKAIKEK